MRTSASNPIQVGILTSEHHGLPGRLGLTIAPGKIDRGRDWDRDLDTDLARLRTEFGGTLLVSLMEKHEYELLKIPDFFERVLHHGFESLRYPIVDVSTPHNPDDALAVVKQIVAALGRGETAIIHCRGGIGRSGLIAAACLVTQGIDADEAIARVRSVREGAVETSAQEKWVRSFATRWVSGALHDRIRGCLLGGAIGDALGYPIEFDSGSAIAARFPNVPDALQLDHGVALVSDDTQMTLFTAEGLIRGLQRFRERGIASAAFVLGRAMLRWYETQTGTKRGKPDGWLLEDQRLWSSRAPGNTCMSSLRKLAQGGDAPTTDAPPNDSKGCGAVMRAAPFGLAFSDPGQAFERALEASVLTQGHPSGFLSAGYLAVVVWHVARGATFAAAMSEADALVVQRAGHEELVAIVGRARVLAKKGVPSMKTIESLGGGWTGEEALAIALLCALTADDFRSALWRAAAHSGDSDSTASICGNILGAMGGTAVLPPAWLANLELRDTIERLADDLDRAYHRGEELDYNDYPPN